MEKFELPVRPWGDADIKHMMRHESLLDNETRVELGLAVSEDAPEAVEEVSTPSEEVVEETTEEVVEDAPEEESTVSVEDEEQTA